jgi:hypothetical protein
MLGHPNSGSLTVVCWDAGPGRSRSLPHVMIGLRDIPVVRADLRRTTTRLRGGTSVGVTTRPDPAGVAGPAVFTLEQTSTASSLVEWLRVAESPGSGRERRRMGGATIGR